MSVLNTNPAKTVLRYGVASLFLIVTVVFTFASKGGGGNKKHDSSFRKDFTPIRSTSPFTLRRMTTYSGSSFLMHERMDNKLAISSMITYQKGNTTFILPYRYKVNVTPMPSASKTNLQFLGVRIQMPK